MQTGVFTLDIAHCDIAYTFIFIEITHIKFIVQIRRGRDKLSLDNI